jgi:hypothetical protein
LQGKKCKKFNFFQNQNDACARLFTLVMKFHDRQSSERCIRKLISRHCLDKTRTRWNDFLFLITDDRDFRPQTCTNGLVFLLFDTFRVSFVSSQGFSKSANPDVLKLFHRHKDFCFSQSKWYSSLFLYWFKVIWNEFLVK